MGVTITLQILSVVNQLTLIKTRVNKYMRPKRHVNWPVMQSAFIR